MTRSNDPRCPPATHARRARAASRPVCVVLLLGAVGCASGGAPGSEEIGASRGDAAMTEERPRQQPLPPPGYGTLVQDEATVSLRSGPLLVKVTPLDEAVTRLMAPDTYERLRALADSRRTEASEGAFQEPALFLVSFFSYEANVNYTPEDLFIVQQGRQTRPLRVIGLNSGFGRQQLGQQETQSAIYSFDAEFDPYLPMTVRYGMEQSNDWDAIVPRLEEERVKVLARAQQPRDAS